MKVIELFEVDLGESLGGNVRHGTKYAYTFYWMLESEDLPIFTKHGLAIDTLFPQHWMAL